MSGTACLPVLSPMGWTRMARTSSQIAQSQYMCLSFIAQSAHSYNHYNCFCCCFSSSTWTPKGDYIASNTDECTATLSYAVSLKKPGTVSFEYFYPDNSIYFEFFVSVFHITVDVDMAVFRDTIWQLLACFFNSCRFRMTSVSQQTHRAGGWISLRATGANTWFVCVQL